MGLASKPLHDLIPVLVREHTLSIKLVWNALHRDLDLVDLDLVEFGVASEGRAHCAGCWVFKEQKDPLE